MHKPIEEAFARAMRLRLKADPDWGWKTLPGTIKTCRITRLTHIESGRVTEHESLSAAGRYLGVRASYLKQAIQLRGGKIQGYLISFPSQG